MTDGARVMQGGLDHTSVARQAVESLLRTEGGRQGLWVVNGEFWAWSGNRWGHRPKTDVEKAVVEWIEDAVIKTGEGDSGCTYERVTNQFSGRDIREVVWIIERMCQAPVQSIPRWLEPGEWPDPDHCIAFDDVVVDIKGTAEARLRGGGSGYITLPRDDRFFGHGVLTVPFRPGDPCPTWITCQEQWSMGAPIWQEVRERAYGRALMGTRKDGKALLEQGLTQSGKGSGTNDVLSKLLPRPAYHSTTMDQVLTDFGLDGLHMAQAWVVSEVRDLDKGSGAKFATILKMVLGRDEASVNIKYQRQLRGMKFKCFPILQSNPMPSFPDDGGAVSSKLIILPFRNSFAGRRDDELPDKLGKELPGIAARLAAAAVRLEMAEPKAKWPLVEGAAEILAQMAMHGNPFDAFLNWGFTKSDSKLIVLHEYLSAKRIEFESETGVKLRRPNGSRVPDTQLLFYLESESGWSLKKVSTKGGKEGLTGLSLKGIA